MIRAGFGAQMADGKPQMAGTGQMAADGRWQKLCHLEPRKFRDLVQLADGRSDSASFSAICE
jgi:hypothetical protein